MLTPLFILASLLLPDEGANVLADKVRPEENGEQSLPEGEVEKADREEPPCEPGESRETMILDFHLVHRHMLNDKRLLQCHYITKKSSFLALFQKKRSPARGR
jgi:hypothetical protein